MEEFDMEVFEAILKKLAAGEALTPEEQASYDSLFKAAGEGVDLTGAPDFQKLVAGFYGDLSGQAKKQFEQLYGEGIVDGPEGITFTRPGSAIEQGMKRGLSVKDAAIQSILSEGLTEYTNQDKELRRQALTSAYNSASKVRKDNLDAMYQSGLLAQGAANRRTAAIGGARRGGGGGGGEMPLPPPTRLPLPPQPDEPEWWEKLLPGLIGLGGSAGLAEWNRYRNEQSRTKAATDREARMEALRSRAMGGGAPNPPDPRLDAMQAQDLERAVGLSPRIDLPRGEALSTDNPLLPSDNPYGTEPVTGQYPDNIAAQTGINPIMWGSAVENQGFPDMMDITTLPTPMMTPQTFDPNFADPGLSQMGGVDWSSYTPPRWDAPSTFDTFQPRSYDWNFDSQWDDPSWGYSDWGGDSYDWSGGYGDDSYGGGYDYGTESYTYDYY